MIYVNDSPALSGSPYCCSFSLFIAFHFAPLRAPPPAEKLARSDSIFSSVGFQKQVFHFPPDLLLPSSSSLAWDVSEGAPFLIQIANYFSLHSFSSALDCFCHSFFPSPLCPLSDLAPRGRGGQSRARLLLINLAQFLGEVSAVMGD